MVLLSPYESKHVSLMGRNTLCIYDWSDSDTHFAIHVAVPHLQKTNGSIIQISALAGLAPMPQKLGPKGIRLNAINPDATQVFEPLPPIWEKTREFTPLKKLGQPLDIAKAVAFLISSDAQFITGANLVVDGGFVYNVGALNQLFQ
ncbi:unnamed protein product [Oppiella nova]|uniref:Uncharacterized protein n=1 Tax=Oppiella nova TaxID=334625 RepID=A0A7R9MC50_9ACAR|nr:unnamed protein product [Oppiella nova]CAG2174507.1 unnamed protein product [Oppiella nova]